MKRLEPPSRLVTPMHPSGHDPDPANGALLSIGALAKATGVSAETLRTWERRYGFPEPSGRTAAGHRYYPLVAVEAVRVALKALARGHRPAYVLSATPDVRRVLAGLDEPSGPAEVHALARPGPEASIEAWLSHTRAFSAEGLSRGFAREWTRLGGVAFLDRMASPFLDAVGARWESGELEVGHEHFATEQLREFLSRQWRPLGDRADVGTVVCATPSGERHVIGLHMAATVLSLAGFGILFLGADVPARDVISAVRRSNAVAAALSASVAFAADDAEGYLRQMELLATGPVRIVVGGRGFAVAADPAERFSGFHALDHWARGFARDLVDARGIA